MEKTCLIAHQADTIGMLVPTVDTVLAPGVITQQDDKRQRHHKPYHIN